MENKRYMETTKVDVMKEIKVKLTDILNSQQSLIEKFAQVQIKLFDNPDKELEDFLNDLSNSQSQRHDKLKEFIENYEIKINQAELQ